jgi:phosphate transport system permease protein
VEVLSEAPLDQGGLPATRSLLLSKQAWKRGRGYRPALLIGGALFAAVVIGVAVSVATGSAQAFSRYGISFVWSGTFSPGEGQYAAGILIIGTLLTTGVALVLAGPVGIGAAIALSELIPKKLAATASSAIELMAAVPSIVVGLWALLVLEPMFAKHVEPFLGSIPVVGDLFSGPAYGPSILLASVVLAIMTLPTLIALSRTALRAVPVEDREAAMALGATRWQVIRKVVLPAARPGIGAAITLAMGRALGEAIAVAMIIGNSPVLPHSLIAPGATLGSAIVNQFAEAQPGLGTSAVIALGAVLLVLTVAVNMGGQALRRTGRSAGSTGYPVGPPAAAPGPAGPRGAEGSEVASAARRGAAPGVVGQQDSNGAVSAAHTLSRRLFRGRVAHLLCVVALAAAAAPLVALIAYTVVRALPALSPGLLFHPVVPAGVPGGGISTAIAGSARAVGLGLLIAAPLGLLIALFLYERKGRVASALRFSADVLTGVPSIVIGIFAFEVVVRPMHKPTTLAAGIALAVLMLPIMVRADEEAIRSVAVDLQEAGAALGASRWRVVRSVVLRGSLPGLVAGNLLALGRAMGETAPLLFTLAAPSLAMTWLIYTDATEPFPAQQQLAWATALVLLAVVFAFSVLARTIAWSLTRRAR